MSEQKRLEAVRISPPPQSQCRKRTLRFAAQDEKKDRYLLPRKLSSSSPVAFRHRVPLSQEESIAALGLLSMAPPTTFRSSNTPLTEAELFEESSLGVLSARQSTNFRGHRQVTIGPADMDRLYELMSRLDGLESPLATSASYAHIVLTRPYRTPFTMLLTFIGHKPLASLLTVPLRGLDKKLRHTDDIPTIGYLQHLHLGILADAMERATAIASSGARRSYVTMAPFAGKYQVRNRAIIQELEKIAGITPRQKAAGWKVGLVALVGDVDDDLGIEPALYRKLGANLLAFRSERIQPGVNQDEKAPEEYQDRQEMDVPDELTVMCGRAAYNAFVRWTGADREASKELLLLERVDVLTPNGKQRLRQIRNMLDDVTDKVTSNIPLWADLPTGKALSRNASRGKKAFALAGQRIYIAGLDKDEIARAGLDWDVSVRALGAAAARSSLFAELMGCVDLPEDCDLLAGMCLMAGPVNQNDIGKTFYGQPDILAHTYPDKDPTSLLVWTLKAKTVADPIGNEEQLLNESRKGALVDLRAGPHEVVRIKRRRAWEPMRVRAGEYNRERAFYDVGNFVRDDSGQAIEHNEGEPWPDRDEPVW